MTTDTAKTTARITWTEDDDQPGTLLGATLTIIDENGIEGTTLDLGTMPYFALGAIVAARGWEIVEDRLHAASFVGGEDGHMSGGLTVRAL